MWTHAILVDLAYLVSKLEHQSPAKRNGSLKLIKTIYGKVPECGNSISHMSNRAW